jgi:hypothetical protein
VGPAGHHSSESHQATVVRPARSLANLTSAGRPSTDHLPSVNRLLGRCLSLASAIKLFSAIGLPRASGACQRGKWSPGTGLASVQVMTSLQRRSPFVLGCRARRPLPTRLMAHHWNGREENFHGPPRHRCWRAGSHRTRLAIPTTATPAQQAGPASSSHPATSTSPWSPTAWIRGGFTTA